MTVRLVVDKITPNNRRMAAQLKRLPRQAFRKFVKETPVRSGNARRNTRLIKEEIVARYPYAERLDDGWSKQSPRGMTAPTLRFIKKKLRQIMRRS